MSIIKLEKRGGFMAKGVKAKVPPFMQGPSGNQIRRQNTRVKQKRKGQNNQPPRQLVFALPSGGGTRGNK
jgi:hypothetical protein